MDARPPSPNRRKKRRTVPAGKVPACGQVFPRVPGWEVAYRMALSAASDAATEWGSHDCALFAAGVVGAITGTDPGAPFRGRYHDAAGAMRQLRRFLIVNDALAPTTEMALSRGGLLGATASVICDIFGWPEHRGIKWAGRGDLVLAMELPEHVAVINPNGVRLGGVLGICTGAQSAFVQRPRGLAFIPTEFCRRAWRIG